MNYQKNIAKQNIASSINVCLINELTHILLYYLREKEILKIRLEVSTLDKADQALILKKLIPYNTKIVTIRDYLEELDNKLTVYKN